MRRTAVCIHSRRTMAARMIGSASSPERAPGPVIGSSPPSPEPTCAVLLVRTPGRLAIRLPDPLPHGESLGRRRRAVRRRLLCGVRRAAEEACLLSLECSGSSDRQTGAPGSAWKRL